MSHFAKFYSAQRDRHAHEAARSRPGDPIRQGRVDRAGPRASARLTIEARGGHHVARLNVVALGSINANPAGGRAAFTWAVFLPGARSTPQPAATFEKAENALRFTIREWFAACGHPLPGE